MANYKILLLDYEPRSLELMVKPLERAGYEVHVAKDGLTGIEAFNRLEPALTIIEAMLPKKHGFDVCQELKSTPHGRLTPIIIITSVYKGRKYRTQALHHYGCDEYLEKPIDETTLLDTVDKLLVSSVGSTPPAATAARTAAEPPTPAHEVNPTPAMGSAASGDNAELEIMERLDELMGGTTEARSTTDEVVHEFDADNETTNEASGEDHGSKVVSFDPQRVLKRRVEAAPNGTVGGSATGASAGGAETAMHQDVEPDAGAAPQPQFVNPEPESAPAVSPGKRSRGWIWFVLVVLILGGAGAAAYYFGLI